MKILLGIRGALAVCLYLCLSTTICHGKDTTIEMVGVGECSDCVQKNVEAAHAFSALRVTIDCKSENGHLKTIGSGELDKQGKFRVALQSDIIQHGKLKEQCYAQLHSTSSNTPCPSSDGLESAKIVVTTISDAQTYLLGLGGTLKFSTKACASAFIGYIKHPHPPLAPLPKWKLPPLGHYKYNFPPLPPKVYPPFPPKVLPPLPPKPSLPPVEPKPKKPCPPSVPKVVKPAPKPAKKPCPPGFKKPLPPIPKLPPIYKKPLPPIPKLPPIYKKPLPPIPKLPPIYKKPLPPIPKLPPIYKKPLPPLPPVPPFYKPLPPIPKLPPIFKKPCPPLPPLPKIHHKFFHHPKFGKWPPMPPYAPIH